VEYLRQIVSDQNTHLLITDGLITAYTQKTNENTDTLNTVQATLDGMNGTLTSYVETVDQHTQDITTVRADLDGMNGTLTAYAERLGDAESEITRVQVTLDGINGELTSKVSKGDLISTINQTAGEVKISASCINLEGYVTTSEFETVSGWADNFEGDTINCVTLSAFKVNSDDGEFGALSIGDAHISDLTLTGTATIGSLTVAKAAASWQKQTVVTGISDALRVSKTSQTITYATPEGGENTINVLTNVQVFAGGHYSTKEINYLGAGASE